MAPELNKLCIGTAGVPKSSPGTDTLSGVETVRKLVLSAMEVEFVHGVRIQQKYAEQIGRRAEELGVALTCHGPYYINLNAKEKQKRSASEKRIFDTARAAHWLGARSCTFHPAFYLGDEPETVHRRVAESLTRIREKMLAKKIDVRLCPETTGKPTQYGSLEELLRLCREMPGMRPCIDFAHLHARSAGANNSTAEFERSLRQVAEALGQGALADLHLHVSGIQYGQKGELKHLQLEESDLKWRELLQVLRRENVGGILIAESPDPESDALLLQKTLTSL